MPLRFSIENDKYAVDFKYIVNISKVKLLHNVLATVTKLTFDTLNINVLTANTCFEWTKKINLP